MKKATFVFLTILIIFFIGCNEQEDYTISIVGEKQIQVDQSVLLLVDSSNRNIELVWSSSDEQVAFIDDEGYLMGLSAGEVVIRVWEKDNEERFAEIVITVIGKTQGNIDMNIVNYFENFYSETVQKRIILPTNEKLEIIESIVYPNTPTRLRPGSGLEGAKMPGGVKYIVIHDTGMPNAEHTASGIDKYIHEQSQPGGRVASWHYSIDDRETYQHVPDDEIAWHAGDGSRAYGTTYFNETYQYWAIGGGNQNGIGIETCINFGGNYQRTLRRTAKLVAYLLNKHDLGIDAVKQHYHFSGKDCPNVVRRTPGRWEELLKEIEFHLFLYQYENVEFTFLVDKPGYINTDGLISDNIIKDTEVNIFLNLKVDGQSYQFKYLVTIKGLTTQEKFQHLHFYLYDNVIPRTTNQSLDLPSYLERYDAFITWTSSHPDILSNDGVYIKPKSSTLVTYTIKIKIDDVEEIKILTVFVS